MLLALFSVTCSPKPDDKSDEALMHAGMEALYARHDPAAAATLFRQILAHTPTHYGATYQLAAALEQAGKSDEARPLWERVLAMAEGYKDTATMDTARARLAQSAAASEQAMMHAGMEALYARHDPAVAATLFRQILAHTPTHYGATYQLAAALDKAGKPAEARPLWEKVMVMAEGYQDKDTADTARARLQSQP